MIRLYLITLLILLATEYGFQSRQSAMTAFLGPWRLRRTLYRLVLWLVTWLLTGLPTAPWQLATLLAAFLLTELMVVILRGRLRRDAAAGGAHGAIITHFLPIAMAIAPPLAAAVIQRVTIGHLSAFAPFIPLSPLKLLVAFTALWSWATLVTVSVIDRVRPESLPKDEEGAVGAGEVIGVLERLLAFVLILHQAPTAVAIGIAAKSAVRFPEFKDKEFAEYFLVGTLTSIGIGIGAAVLTFL